MYNIDSDTQSARAGEESGMRNKFRVIGKSVAFDIERRGGDVKKVFVSKESLPKLLKNDVRWSIIQEGGGKIRVVGRVRGVQTSLPIFLMGRRKGKVIEHIDGNPLNNRLNNLRFVSLASQARKRSKEQSSMKSGVREVVYNRITGMWKACVKYEGKVIFERVYMKDSLQLAIQEVSEVKQKLEDGSYFKR